MTPHTAELTIRRLGSMAGRTAYAVTYTLVDAEGFRHPGAAQFHGDTASDPATGVVMVTDSIRGGIRVSDPARLGPFGPAWVAAFYGLPLSAVTLK